MTDDYAVTVDVRLETDATVAADTATAAVEVAADSVRDQLVASPLDLDPDDVQIRVLSVAQPEVNAGP